MTTKQNVQNLAAVAHALIAKLPRMTLAAAVAEWNAVAGKFEIIGVPGRKAHLERLLTALVADIESEDAEALEMDAQRQPAKKVKTIKACDLKKGDIFVNPSFGGELKVSGVLGSLTGRKETHISFEIGGGTSYPDNCNITILDMDAIHAEALEMNTFHDEVQEVAAKEQLDEWANTHDSRTTPAEWLEIEHAEALEEYDARNTLYVYAPGDAAREVWDQMTPVEQSVSVELRHAEALIENDEFDGIIRDGLTPEQRAIQTHRESMDIYGERFAKMYAQDYADALEINELVSIGADAPRFMPHLIIKRRAGGYALYVSDINPKTTLNPLAASFWDVMPGDPVSEREARSKMRQFMREGDTITSIGEAVGEAMKFALGPSWIEIVRRWEVAK